MDIFSIFPVTTPGTDALPEPEVPYYALAHEGLFLHRKTQIGTVLVKQTSMPKNAALAKLGHEQGVFTWTGEKIPGRIISQATDFFRRIYEKYHSEAEVLITMHNDTKEFKLFVPYQRVSHMGVKSIYEPTNIDREYTVVGTIHSHCDFSAFHSGTDSADASDMDGIHFTIGMITREHPEVVAMVAMNKKEFHYTDPNDVAELVFDGEKSPPWWDEYVFPTTTNAAKPKRMRSISQEQWDAFRGLTPPSHIAKPKPAPSPTSYRSNYTPYKGNKGFGYYDEDADWSQYPYGHYGQNYQQQLVPFKPTKESERFNKKRGKKNGDSEDPIDKAIDLAILEGILVSEDWTPMQAHDLDSPQMWRQFFLDKLDIVCDVLNLLDVEVEYNAAERSL